MKKPSAKRRRSGGAGFRIFIYLSLFALFVILILRYTNRRVMPSVIKTMETHAINTASRVIDSSLKAVISQTGITSADLYVKTESDDGRLMSLSANTMLINSMCADVSEEVVKRLGIIGNETVRLPLGVITGIDFLSTKGPEVFEIAVKPLGHCVVDYKTSFKSEGINQVNYQIWLEIKASVSAVNPVFDKAFIVERRLPVVNTYISGDVPGSMLYPFKIDENTAN